MFRRSFLALLSMAPAVAVVSAIPQAAAACDDTCEVPVGKFLPGYHRLSIEKDDPGYIPFGEFMADYGAPEILLDGVVTKCITVDAAEGWVKRHHISPAGNLCVVDGELITEIVHGQVEIRVKGEAARAEPPFIFNGGQFHINPIAFRR